MKNIHTLIPDIQELLKTKGWFNDELKSSFSEEIAGRLSGQFEERTLRPSLRLSQMGPKCPRALWFSINNPEVAEQLPPWAQFKFSFGHIIEGLAIALAKAAGHEVVGEQDELVLDGIVGHRDCIIDGCLVDVKSASSISYLKFKDGSIAEKDDFGYLDQLDGYLAASADDPLLRVKDRGYLLAIDKQLGHMCLYEHRFRENHIRERIQEYKRVVALPTPPPCECKTVAVGESGNIGLATTASYSPYKYACFPELRTFLYKKGNDYRPVHLIKVVRKPDVTEVDRYGNPVY